VSETWWLKKPGIPHLAQVKHQSWTLNFIYNPNIPTLLVLNTTYLNVYIQSVPGKMNQAVGEHALG